MTHEIAVLVYEGLHTFEFGCVLEVLGRDFGRFEPRYRVRTFSADGGAVRGQGGLTILPDAGLELSAKVQTIVVPGWNVEVAPSTELVDALRAAHAGGTRLASICTGAFLLAEAGLLNGGRATTHWLFKEEFERRFPDIALDDAPLYCTWNNVVTSAGSAAGLDMLLDLVRTDFGSDICNERARRLVLAPHRSGGQAQFIPTPVARVGDNRISSVVEWIQAHCTDQVPMASIARQHGMSPRTFYRRFKDAVGMSPTQFVLQERIRSARILLEQEDKVSVEVVAHITGFGSPESFRRHFRRSLGSSPTRYRQENSLRAASSN